MDGLAVNVDVDGWMDGGLDGSGFIVRLKNGENKCFGQGKVREEERTIDIRSQGGTFF